MNARISKIAQDTDAWCDKYYFGDKFYDLEWEKKFADLIIVRCIMACTANLADPRDTPELRCATRIREYFYESQN